MSTYMTTLGAVLSITTGIVVGPVDEMFALQDFLVGRSLMTHERIVGADEQISALLNQFPSLAEAEPPKFDRSSAISMEDQCRAWVRSVAEHVGFDTCIVTSVHGLEVDPAEAWEKVLSGLGKRA